MQRAPVRRAEQQVASTGEPSEVFDAADLHIESDGVQTVDRVVEFSLSAIGADAAALMLLSRGELDTVIATGPEVEIADELQFRVDEGPCLAALRDGTSVRIRDTATDDRWPTWARATAAIGFRSVLCVQLSDDRGPIGALNLYSRAVDAFDEDDRAVAHVLARHAAIAVRTARQIANLQVAIDARKLIGQAQGILMERYQLDADQAFAVLQRYSQHNNVKLRVIAQQLVETRQLPAGG